MQPAELAHDVMTGAEEEVIRIGEDDLGAGRPQIIGAEALHRPLRRHRHEGRRLDLAVGRAQPSGARGAVGLDDRELDGAHPTRLSEKPGLER